MEAGRIEKREKTTKCHARDVEPVWIGMPTSLNGTAAEYELPLSTFYPLGGVIEIL